MRTLWMALAGLLVISVTALPSVNEKKPADDCDWVFAGSDRKKVKLRTVEDEIAGHYTKHNGGAAITVTDFKTFTCGLDPQVPPKKKIPKTKAMKDIETVRITVHAFLLGAKFERDDDHDIHAEVGETADWNTDHIVVEVPPGPAYCSARQTLWGLVKQDVSASGLTTVPDIWIMKTPQEITLQGYVFLDSHHASATATDYCSQSGGRGIHDATHPAKVNSLWEVHPLTDMTVGP